jgi:hypothetical protein
LAKKGHLPQQVLPMPPRRSPGSARNPPVPPPQELPWPHLVALVL